MHVISMYYTFYIRKVVLSQRIIIVDKRKSDRSRQKGVINIDFS